MKIFLILAAVVFLSCNNQQTQKNIPEISDANKIRLTFKTDFDSTGKIVLKSFDVTDFKEIESIKKTISSEPFFYQYCLSTGSITFFKDSVNLFEMVFNTTPDFRHIAYNYNNKVIAVALSAKDADYLDSFRKKLN